MLTKIILGSTVIAAICSGIVSYIISKRQGNLQYITAERKEWREKIRNIAKKLDGASYYDTLDILTDLKVRINSFGNNVSERYDDDAHIWEVIKELEKKRISDKVLRQMQEQLVEYLSLLLKMDWERSKREVKGNIHNVISGVSYLLIIIYFSTCVFLKNANDEYGEFELVTMIAFFCVLIIIFQSVHMLIVRNIYKCDLKADISPKPKKSAFAIYTKCHMMCIAEFLLMMSVFSLVIITAFDKIDYNSQNVLSISLLMLAYALGLGNQMLPCMSMLEQEYSYMVAIEKCKEKHTCKS